MPKKIYKDIPDDYTVCQCDDCPRAASCLHQLAYQPLLEKNNVLRLLNPRQCTKDDRCPHFRDSVPVTYARGFIGMQKKMYPDQYRNFMSRLVSHFGRNPYFERRRGDVPISPREQALIRQTLRRVGVTEDLKFDAYEELVNWRD